MLRPGGPASTCLSRWASQVVKELLATWPLALATSPEPRQLLSLLRSHMASPRRSYAVRDWSLIYARLAGLEGLEDLRRSRVDRSHLVSISWPRSSIDAPNHVGAMNLCLRDDVCLRNRPFPRPQDLLLGGFLVRQEA